MQGKRVDSMARQAGSTVRYHCGCGWLQADKILAQIESFWSYTEIMLEKATQMREHLEIFVDVNSHTSPSPGMHQRFCVRINQYEQFWNVLRALCDK